jgi:hypothetical protein
MTGRGGAGANGVDDSRRFGGGGLLMGAQRDVASKRLPVLHIRLNLPEN